MQTILIAEDESAIRKLIATVLRGAGYEVLAAAHGEEAVHVAAKHAGAIDLLITDIVMAGMGGADLYAWLKTERPEIKVLFISGYMNREPLEGSFLKKPFGPAELVARVREMLAPRTEAAR